MLARPRGEYHTAPASRGSAGDGNTGLPRQGQPWDIAGSTQVLLRTMAMASPGMLEGASPLPSCHRPWYCLFQSMASKASSIPVQQRGDPATGTRDASSMSDHFIATVATGQTLFPDRVWVQPLDPSNTVEKLASTPTHRY